MSETERNQIAAAARQIMANAQLRAAARRLLGDKGPAVAEKHLREAAHR